MEPSKIIMLPSYNRKPTPKLKELQAKDEFSWKIKVEDFLSGIIIPHYQWPDCDGSGRSHLFVEYLINEKRANQ